MMNAEFVRIKSPWSRTVLFATKRSSGAVSMGKWKLDAKEFTVKVDCYKDRGCKVQVPKPIMDLLEDPKTIKYIVRGSKIEFQRGDQE